MCLCAYPYCTTTNVDPTTWRPPNRGEIVCFIFFVLVCFVCLLGSITTASGRFRSGCRTVVALCFRVCLVCVFLLSITTVSARLLSFRRPNRGDIVYFGSVQRVPPFCRRRFRLPPYIQAVESWLCCNSSCFCALLTPTKEFVIWSYCAFGYHCVVFWVLS